MPLNKKPKSPKKPAMKPRPVGRAEATSELMRRLEERNERKKKNDYDDYE